MNRFFYFFVVASFISLLGDQLSLIAFPWLVLSLTENGSAMGAVFALMGIPRAIALIVGGALTDKYNPIKLLFFARLMSAVCLSAVLYLLLIEELSLWFFLPLAFLHGLSGAAGIPASMALITRILPKDKLKGGNSLLMSVNQLTLLLGPLIAGALLMLFSDASNIPTREGFIFVFALDVATFVLSAVLIVLVKVDKLKSLSKKSSSIFSYLKEGGSYLKRRTDVSVLLLYVAAINFFIQGPVKVGLPILVSQSLSGSTLDYATLLTVMGVGAFLSTALFKYLPDLSQRNFSLWLICLDICSAILLYLFVNSINFYFMHLIMFIEGFIAGYILISVRTLLQSRVEAEYMGRVMSYFSFAIFGFIPFSAALSGVLIDSIGVTAMFEVMALALFFTALWFFLSKSLNKVISPPKQALTSENT